MEEIATIKNISLHSARVHLALMKKKGFKFTGVRDEATNKISHYEIQDPRPTQYLKIIKSKYISNKYILF